MAPPAQRRPGRRRRLRRRSALPRSRRALVLGTGTAAVVLLLLLVGRSRTAPGHHVPDYDPATASTSVLLPVPPPSVTVRGGVTTASVSVP